MKEKKKLITLAKKQTKNKNKIKLLAKKIIWRENKKIKKGTKKCLS